MMGKDMFRKLFCTKIGIELENYKRRVLKLKPEEIYRRAYQIDSMIQIYELLMEQSQKISEEMLQVMIVVPNLLAFLYRRWMQRVDSSEAELFECIMENAEKLKEILAVALPGKQEDAA